MAEQGYTPNLPIVLVPGFASSGLRVVESSHKPWVNDRVWLSLNKIMSQNARKRLDVGRSKKCYDTIDFANKVRLINFFCFFLFLNLYFYSSINLFNCFDVFFFFFLEFVDQAHLFGSGGLS